MWNRAYYSADIGKFLQASQAEILGELACASPSVEQTQTDAWVVQISLLKSALFGFEDRGKIYFEFSIPRLGRRIDVLLLLDHLIFVLEFKVGSSLRSNSAIDQVWDYGLDLKNFHEASHHAQIVPILIPTEFTGGAAPEAINFHSDGVHVPICIAKEQIRSTLVRLLEATASRRLDASKWESGRYKPTPTIIEAASALYSEHSVAELSRNDAGAINLAETSVAIRQLIEIARADKQKIICFVTGVPGAGKTLVGLNVATDQLTTDQAALSIYLSGNGPLVAILREALARDRTRREAALGRKIKKGDARRAVETFIQNVHHFRDDCLRGTEPPPEHVAVFDEAQRAWDRDQTMAFMSRKRKQVGFTQSEPEFLISCMDRHSDWAVVVCLVGHGQEINTGEAGIAEWLDSLQRSFSSWRIVVSPQLGQIEPKVAPTLKSAEADGRVSYSDSLHLSTSLRSFRSESVATYVSKLLDLEADAACAVLAQIGARYPIVLTRCPERAKAWLRKKARGSERYGMMVSSQAMRLKPHAIDVRVPIDPVHWFLNDKADVRSSYYLEDVATEFHVQGLEVDWACVVWDGDLRHSGTAWEHFSFVGDRWQHVRKLERQQYLKNAYRVLLTRARQGMVIVVPEGNPDDPTRQYGIYDPTFSYLRSTGLPVI